MRRSLSPVLLLIAVIWPLPAPAQNAWMAGHDLQPLCAKPFSSKPGDAIRNAFCEGYIAGVAAALREVVDADGNRRICFAERVRAQELADIVRRYLSHNPQRLDRDAALLVKEALAQAFTCSN